MPPPSNVAKPDAAVFHAEPFFHLYAKLGNRKLIHCQNWPAIMADDDAPITCIRSALDFRFGTWRFGPPASPLDFSARSWADLLLRVLLADISNSRIDWAAWNSPCRRIPAGAGRAIRPCGLLVCADTAVAFEWAAHGYGDLLGGHDRLCAAGPELLAARYVDDLFRVLPLVCECGARFLCLSVRWNAAGGGIHRDVFRPEWISATLGRRESALASEPFPADMGRLPDLFRIGRGENNGRRPAVAELHRTRRVLPEWSAADVDRLVHAALAALVPCGDRVWNFGAGTRAGMDDVSAETFASIVLSDRHAVADRHHSLGELHVSELSGSRAGLSLAR